MKGLSESCDETYDDDSRIEYNDYNYNEYNYDNNNHDDRDEELSVDSRWR